MSPQKLGLNTVGVSAKLSEVTITLTRIHPFILPHSHTLIYSLILTHILIHSLICSLPNTRLYILTHTLIHSFVHPATHPYSFSYTLTHVLTLSLTFVHSQHTQLLRQHLPTGEFAYFPLE